MFLLLIPFSDFIAKILINGTRTKDSQGIRGRKRQVGWFFDSCAKTEKGEERTGIERFGVNGKSIRENRVTTKNLNLL